MIRTRIALFIACWLFLFTACSPALKTVSVEPSPPRTAIKPPGKQPGPPEGSAPLPVAETTPSPPTDIDALPQNTGRPIEEMPLSSPEPMEAARPTEEPKEIETDIQEEPPESAGDILKAQKPDEILEESLNFCQAAHDFWQKGEVENALEALDQAYTLILSVEPGEDPALIQQKEDLRFMISKRILEVYASRHIAANGKNNGIPLEVNRHVQAEIDSFSKGREKDFFIASYRRSGKFRPFILEEFKEAGIPPELSWLPLIESGFKVNAFSKARALGMWQFIPSTGYKFGLERNTFVDERMDPAKSTEAAIAYLKELHNIFGDWITAIAAYNCGENRVLRVIREQNVQYLDNFWDLYERLPRETARYVPRFLATLHMVNHPEKYGLDKVSPDPPLSYETATIRKQVHLRDVARKIGVELSDLKALNPELRYQVVPPGPYPLRVPSGKREIVLAAVDTLSEAGPPRPAFIKHRIRRGETLSTIARRYHVSMNRIAAANGIHRKSRIIAGHTLKIPQSGVSVYRAETAGPSSETKTVAHVVRRGESLWRLAKVYDTTISAIRDFNGLSGTRLTTGQVLKIPARSRAAPPAGTLRTYTVRKGDSPYKIAMRFSMSLEQFLSVNRLTPKSRIYPDQTVYVR